MKTFLRQVKHFFKSGVAVLGVEHFLAMFPATILVPIMINNKFNATIVDVALVILTSGIGTLLFLMISRGKIPAYLSSSFAYIGLTIYLITGYTNQGISANIAYVYVGWSYAFAGGLLLILSIICRIKHIADVLSFLLPAPIIGPAISLIGLELASTAIADSGFNTIATTSDMWNPIIAVATLVAIILLSVTKHKFLKNSAIVGGMIVGCIVFFVVHGFSIDTTNLKNLFEVPNIKLPVLQIPPNIVGLFVSVIPATLVIFIENIGRLTIIERMKNQHSDTEPIFNNRVTASLSSSLVSHSVAVIASAVLGSVPNTIYTENIAVMNIHSINEKPNMDDDENKFIKSLYNSYSCIPYVVAAFLAIAVSFLGVMQTLLLNIPKCVIGGMELFLFGIISAPGIQLLVDQRINYKKLSNQLLTASVLIAGISGLSLNFGFVELKGMSLGFMVGIILNLVFQLLKRFGRLNDHISLEEILLHCIRHMDSEWMIDSVNQSSKLPSGKNREDTTLNGIHAPTIFDSLKGNSKTEITSQSGQALSSGYIRTVIGNASKITLKMSQTDVIIVISETINNKFIDIYGLTEQQATKLVRDFNDCDYDKNSCKLSVNVNGRIPEKIITTSLRELTKNKENGLVE